MTPRTQNLLSVGALVAALVIAAFPVKAQTSSRGEMLTAPTATSLRASR